MNKKIKLSENAEIVAKSRYFNNGEDWESCAFRVADSIASVEKDKKLYTEKFHNMIYNMDFLPGGRILRNASRAKGSLLNCYVLPIDDSIEDIGTYISNALRLWSEGGGCGANFSLLRPRGDSILGKGGHSSGMVSFIKAADVVSKTIESGGQRRAAALACCDVSHPEIIDFINAKVVDKELSHFNISVLINEEFIKCVENDGDWVFKFKQKEYGKVKARDLWNLIVSNMITKAEPGFLNSTNLYKNNSWYYDPVVSTNPCWSGETLVAVADGRGEVSFRKLAEEGKDVPVFSFNPESKEIEIKIMRNPRITSKSEKMLKITLDDGSILRCTKNHLLVDKNGIEVSAIDLKIGDRLHHMTKNYGYSLKGKQEPVSMFNGYRNKKGYCFEHRIQGEFLIGRKLFDGEDVHHRDENNQHNSFDNLQLMDHAVHTSGHQIGNKNTMRDKWWNNQSDEVKNEYRKNMSKSTSGNKNGNWVGYSIEELKNIACDYMTKVGKKITVKEWVNYCKENKYPHTITARTKFISECYNELSLNYIVCSIEEDGYETVYNGTVDDFHNYYVFTNNGFTKTGKPRKNYILSKNCGEAVLENYGSCCLGSLVLPNFITGNINTNWKKLQSVIKLAVRFLDNVIDVNKYSLNEISMKAHNSRRIGLGVLGLAEYLFAKQLRYGSEDAIYEIEKLMRFIRDETYVALVELSIEKGSFPKFDPVQYGNSSFVRKLPAQLRMDIKNKGVRCVTALSMAPNGTISLLTGYTGGIEPLMAKAYRRSDRVGERIYIHPRYRELLLSGGKIPDWFVDVHDLSPKDHFETQAIIQKYTDGAVSKTINLPKGTTVDELNDLLLEYIRDLKGVTIYVDGSREGQVYNKISEEEIFDIIAQETIGVSDSVDLEDVECNCQKQKDENDEEIEVCEIPLKKEN